MGDAPTDPLVASFERQAMRSALGIDHSIIDTRAHLSAVLAAARTAAREGFANADSIDDLARAIAAADGAR